MSNDYSVSGYVEGWCTKCNLELGHTIIAMVDNLPVKVKCNTCNSEHKFRTKQSGVSRTKSPKSPKSAKSTSPARKIKAQEASYNEYMARLTDHDLSRVRIYNLNGSFKKDEIIEHSKFGVGIVLSVIQDKKIEILFKDGTKILIHDNWVSP